MPAFNRDLTTVSHTTAAGCKAEFALHFGAALRPKDASVYFRYDVVSAIMLLQCCALILYPAGSARTAAVTNFLHDLAAQGLHGHTEVHQLPRFAAHAPAAQRVTTA